MADAPAPGWYPNPENALTERYWDGSAWSDQTRPIPPPKPKSRAVKVASSAWRIFFLTVVAVFILVVLLYVFSPVLEGYHFGCNVLNGDTQQTTRIGIQFCKASAPTPAPAQNTGNAAPAQNSGNSSAAQNTGGVEPTQSTGSAAPVQSTGNTAPGPSTNPNYKAPTGKTITSSECPSSGPSGGELPDGQPCVGPPGTG